MPVSSENATSQLQCKISSPPTAQLPHRPAGARKAAPTLEGTRPTDHNPTTGSPSWGTFRATAVQQPRACGGSAVNCRQLPSTAVEGLFHGPAAGSRGCARRALSAAGGQGQMPEQRGTRQTLLVVRSRIDKTPVRYKSHLTTGSSIGNHACRSASATSTRLTHVDETDERASRPPPLPSGATLGARPTTAPLTRRACQLAAELRAAVGVVTKAVGNSEPTRATRTFGSLRL